jgi:hypothetical protein
MSGYRNIMLGQDWVKQTSQRTAQVSAITPTHAVMYWPDKDEQTTVRLDRFNRTTEWRLANIDTRHC